MRVNKAGIFVFSVVFLFLLSARADAAVEYARAIIFYYDWDVLVRSALSADDVRSRYFMKTEITDAMYTRNLAKAFPKNSYEILKSPEKVDVRLVIDLYTTDGKLVTCYATSFHLYFDGGYKRVPIDESFKDKFRFFLKP